MESTRARVIAAHKQLMTMNERNAETFKDLVAALEQEDCEQQAGERADVSKAEV
jgi:hypothetical protein